MTDTIHTADGRELPVADAPTDADAYDDVKRTLERSCCRLKQAYPDGDRHRFEYVTPEPGWPDPLGYITTETPEWVGPQAYWSRDGQVFTGNVSGSIPDAGDCDRHPDLPTDAFALTRVGLRHPDKLTGKFGCYTRLEPVDGAWQAGLTYEQVHKSSRAPVELYSTELGEWADGTLWKAAPHRRRERRRYEYFDTLEAARAFVTEETGLAVPERLTA